MRTVINLSFRRPDGTEGTVDVPARWQICSRCGGNGSHSLRIGAISAEEWERDWDEESRELYISGGLNEQCEVCKGEGKVKVVDISDDDSLTEDERLSRLRSEDQRLAVKQLWADQDEDAAAASERYWESRMLGEC